MHPEQTAFENNVGKEEIARKKLLVTSNFFFSHDVFYSIRKLYPHLSIFMTSYLCLLLNWKSPKVACELPCQTAQNLQSNFWINNITYGDAFSEEKHL